MRKRVFFPLFVLFVFFPLIVYLLSYTRFFNDEVRKVLISVVDDGTNATLHLGEIHGSVFGTFTIDGAALLYHGKPIAMVDTVSVSHLPLSLVTKTVQATHVKLIRPRFYLIRSMDGSFNVDHIGKPGGKPGGKFDWTILASSLRIVRGEFELYDSIAAAGSDPPGMKGGPKPARLFNASDFTVKNLDLNASAELSGDNLSATIRRMSMKVTPPGFNVDSLKFDFFTTPFGTEVTGLRLASGRMLLHVDVTLEGQDLLDSLNARTIRNKYFTANVEAVRGDVGKIGGFVRLPIDSPSDFNLSLFASGTLDTLNVKQCLLKTDSSFFPLTASFHHLLDSNLTMNVSMENAGVEMGELSSVLKKVGFPDAGRLRRMNVTASVAGPPSDLKVSARLANPTTSITADSRIRPGQYSGAVEFKGLNVGEVFPATDLNTRFSGASQFNLVVNGRKVPVGRIELSMDSSSFDHTIISKAFAEVQSSGDSLGVNFNFLTSKGNLDGTASLNVPDESYFGDLRFGEFDAAPFLHVPTLKTNLTGELLMNGDGFDIDSLRTQLTLMTEHSSLGDFQLGSSAFTVALNTEKSERELQIHSPFFDASVNGHFVPHELPGHLAGLFSSIADSFASKFSGVTDTMNATVKRLPDMDADVDVDVKDARLLGQILGSKELMGRASTHFHLVADRDSVSMSGYLAADTVNYVQDSLRFDGGRVNVGFNFRSNPDLSVWRSGNWTTDASVGSFTLGGTRLAAEYCHVRFDHGDSAQPAALAIRVRGEVDTLVGFSMGARASMEGNRFNFVTDSLDGRFYGVPLFSEAPVSITYAPETFTIRPATFRTGLGGNGLDSLSLVTASGGYSLRTGANLHFLFENFDLRSLQKIARIDTNALKLNGRINGEAAIHNSDKSMLVGVDFNGRNVFYNGSVARSLKGRIDLRGQSMDISADLSKDDDSASYALKLDGTIPLSGESGSQMRLGLTADSLNVSFMTPLLTGIEDFGGILSGHMVVSGKYSSPQMEGKLTVDDGKIRLAANEVNYLYNGTIIGDGDMLRLAPLVVRNIPGQPGGTMTASGSLTIGRNTIQKFNLDFNGSVLALNSPARRTLHGIYGSAVVGAGKGGLRLEGSLERPMLLGTLNIESADLTLLPIQRRESLPAQEIIYRYPTVVSKEKSSPDTLQAAVTSATVRSGSLIDSLRYNVEVETKDNVNLRMIFDPTTNEELDAVLSGRLHLSNLSGSMELTGVVSLPNNSNSYYNFYGRHFNATGKLSFTGDPLNPMMNITAQYQGELADTASGTSNATKTPSVVVVQLGITGTFNQPNAPSISMTKDGVPYQQGDVQTNAMWFILTNTFADQIPSQAKNRLADNIWNQAAPGLLSAGTSVLSGALTNLFSREFSFVRSAELRYSSISDLANPDLAITTQFGKATIRVGGQVFSDINNTDVSVDYPLTQLLGNMLYLQLSHKIALNNRTYFQRETVNALRLFYQLSF